MLVCPVCQRLCRREREREPFCLPSLSLARDRRKMAEPLALVGVAGVVAGLVPGRRALFAAWSRLRSTRGLTRTGRR